MIAPITLSLVSPADLLDFAKIYLDAYAVGFCAVNKYPLHLRPGKEELAGLMAAAERERWVDREMPRGQVWVMARLNETGETVGFAEWFTPDQWKATGEHPPTRADPTTPAQVELARYIDWDFDDENRTQTWKQRREMFPDCGKHWFLMDLIVHPDYQHQGIGTALIEDGFTRARADPAFAGTSPVFLLQASPMGYGLYRRMGFEGIEAKYLYKRGKYMEDGVLGEVEEIDDGVWKYKYKHPTMLRKEMTVVEIEDE